MKDVVRVWRLQTLQQFDDDRAFIIISSPSDVDDENCELWARLNLLDSSSPCIFRHSINLNAKHADPNEDDWVRRNFHRVSAMSRVVAFWHRHTTLESLTGPKFLREIWRGQNYEGICHKFSVFFKFWAHFSFKNASLENLKLNDFFTIFLSAEHLPHARTTDLKEFFTFSSLPRLTLQSMNRRKKNSQNRE